MNYAIEVLRSKRYKLQNALNDLDKTNHLKSTRESLESKIESIDSLLKLAEEINLIHINN